MLPHRSTWMLLSWLALGACSTDTVRSPNTFEGLDASTDSGSSPNGGDLDGGDGNDAASGAAVEDAGAAGAEAGAERDSGMGADAGTTSLALVYRGPGACEGCAESLARLLERAGLTTRYVGAADLKSDATFAGARLYAQPGGDDTMQVYDAVGASAWPGVAKRLQAFVSGGGRYLGVCAGGFLAGEWMDDNATIKALDLLAGEVSYFEATPIDYTQDQVITIDWLKPAMEREVYFQEGPSFSASGSEYARFSDGSSAALIDSYGQGKVGVSGIHFEAEDDWYSAYNLDDADGVDWELGVQLIQDLVE